MDCFPAPGSPALCLLSLLSPTYPSHCGFQYLSPYIPKQDSALVWWMVSICFPDLLLMF